MTTSSTGVGQKTVNRKRPFATCRSISCFLATTSLTNSPKASRACQPRLEPTRWPKELPASPRQPKTQAMREHASMP